MSMTRWPSVVRLSIIIRTFSRSLQVNVCSNPPGAILNAILKR